MQLIGGMYLPDPWLNASGIVQLRDVANTVVIGGVAMLAGEKLRVVGGVVADEASAGGADGYVELGHGSLTPASTANTVRTRYLNGTAPEALQVSFNAGAYRNLAIGTLDLVTAGCVAGDLVYVSAAGTVSKADASALATALVTGVVVASGPAGATQVQDSGRVTMTVETGIAILAGERLYLSLDAGLVTNVAPVAAGEIVAPVGISLANGTGLGPGATVDALLRIGEPEVR